MGDEIRVFLEDSVEVFGYFSKTYSGYPPGDVRMLLSEGLGVENS